MYFTCTGFEILWQSPANISLNSTKTAALLYCIASRHGQCIYAWYKLGSKDRKYQSTPVLYITEAGLYQCTVKMGSEARTGRVITVKVTAG